MSTQRISMRKIREILRLHHRHNLSRRKIATSCKVSPATVTEYILRARDAGLCWPLPDDLDDRALEKLLFPGRMDTSRPLPDFAAVHQELKKKHVTQVLLWEEYKEQHPDGLHYSQFCYHYRQWAKTLDVTMRQHHKAGDKMFVDFSGDGLELIDSQTGLVQRAKLFVAVLGASNLTYVEAVVSEDLPTWIACHNRAFSYFGGVTTVTVPDNLKSGVTRPDHYDPELNPTYAEWGEHYGTAIIPARVRKPRDKAKVEQGVLLAERWILARLRHRDFGTLADVREAISPLLEELNHRPMQKLHQSRWQMFETFEREALKPLPTHPYVMATWKKAKVNIDYHVAFDDHYYSVPFRYAQEHVELRATSTTVEIFFQHRRIASHQRSPHKHQATTVKEHMPQAHQKYLDWTPSRIIAWGNRVGPNTATLLEKIMENRTFPEQGYRSCLGILRLRESFSDERIEKACARGLHYKSYSRKSLLAILKNNLDEKPLEKKEQLALPLHNNLRGSDYYH